MKKLYINNASIFHFACFICFIIIDLLIKLSGAQFGHSRILYRVPTYHGKVREIVFSSRSGKSQGIL